MTNVESIVEEGIEQYDLVVVGTGFHGLSMARTYLQLNPDASVVLYDTAAGIGGVWATERLYPGLKTNNHIGKYEFSDFPMEQAGLRYDDHIPGKNVNEYLNLYAEKFDLMRRMKFNSKVGTAEDKGAQGWLLTVVPSIGREERARQILAAKLVVAAGLTSEPRMPSFPGQEDFKGQLFHSKEYAVRAEGLKHAKSVVVYSGAKSAWDVAHSYASSGVQVDWVIRSDGHGPCYMTPKRVMGPFQVIPETLISTRFVTWLSPCIWGDYDGFTYVRKFFNQTLLGRTLLKIWPALMSAGNSVENGYDRHPETAKLKPWVSVFWIGSASRGALNYDSDIFQLVRDGKIRVHVANVSHFTENAVHLSNSTILEPDAFICCTGWRHELTMKFLRDGKDIVDELGLPHASTNTKQDPLLERADSEILSRFPILKEQPAPRSRFMSSKPAPSTSTPQDTIDRPFELYRFVVPPAYITTRTIAFSGVARTASTCLIAQAQALWITAYFTSRLFHLKNPNLSSKFMESIRYETLLYSRFGRWRYPHGWGALFPDFFWDALPYVDMLLRDLGLKWRRKKGPWRECFESYTPNDYKGLVEEWVASEKRMDSDGKKLRERAGEESAKGIVRMPSEKVSVLVESYAGLVMGVLGIFALLGFTSAGIMALCDRSRRA